MAALWGCAKGPSHKSKITMLVIKIIEGSMAGCETQSYTCQAQLSKTDFFMVYSKSHQRSVLSSEYFIARIVLSIANRRLPPSFCSFI